MEHLSQEIVFWSSAVAGQVAANLYACTLWSASSLHVFPNLWQEIGVSLGGVGVSKRLSPVVHELSTDFPQFNPQL